MSEQARVKKVLENMIHLVETDEDYADMFSDGLDQYLEEIAMHDGFGTERQMDPRGDGRNGDFTMNYVEGIDD